MKNYFYRSIILLGMAALPGLSMTACSPDEKESVPSTTQETVKELNKHSPEKIKDEVFPHSAEEGWTKPAPDYKWVPSWQQDSDLNFPRASPAVVAAAGHIYVIGGGDPFGENNKYQESVEFAKIRPDGSLEPWQLTSPMNVSRMHTAAVEANGWIYAIGGEKGARFEDLLNSVEMARIQPDGSLGPWKYSIPMQTPRRGLVASYYNGWIYAFGGFNGTFLKDILQTEIKPDGSLNEWLWESEDAKNKRYIHSGILYKNHVYLFGGHLSSAEKATSTAEWNTIGKDGELGDWLEATKMRVPRFGSGAVVLRDTVYLLGGDNTVSLASVEKAPFASDGSVGRWSEETPLTTKRVGISVTAWNDVIYVIGGFSRKKYLKDVLRAHYLKGSRLGRWTNDPEIIAKAAKAEHATHPDAITHYDKGYERYQKGHVEEAIIDFKHAVNIAPRSAPPRFLLGVAYEANGQIKEATEEYRTAAHLSPGDIDTLSRLANILEKQGEPGEAELQYSRILELKPKLEKAALRLIKLHIRSGKCEQARKEVNSLKIEKPDSEILSGLEKNC